MNNLDINKIANSVIEITKQYKKIVSLFPPGNNEILRHLAASSIHMTLFIKDLKEIHTGEKDPVDIKKEINEFLNTCGCKFKENTINE